MYNKVASHDSAAVLLQGPSFARGLVHAHRHRSALWKDRSEAGSGIRGTNPNCNPIHRALWKENSVSRAT